MTHRQTLPVLPLRETVIFPGVTQPIAAGRPGTLRAIESALKGDRLVFAVAQRDNSDEPTAEVLYQTGVIARIGQIQRVTRGVQLLLQGEQRAQALQYSTTDGHLQAVVVPADGVPPLDEHEPNFTALHQLTRAATVELSTLRGLPEEVAHQVLDSVTDAGKFSDLVAGYIELSVGEKQGLLETLSVEERLRRVLVHVQRQVAIRKLQEEVRNEVESDLQARQREIALRERLTVIRRKLGAAELGDSPLDPKREAVLYEQLRDVEEELGERDRVAQGETPPDRVAPMSTPPHASAQLQPSASQAAGQITAVDAARPVAHEVFITHSQKDAQVARAVCDALEAGGVPCWIAPRNVPPGQPWKRSIVSAIRASRVMVLVFSGEANRSAQVEREVDIAFEVSPPIPIFPFRIENVAMGEDLYYCVGARHWIDALTPPLDAHIAHLVAAVRATVGRLSAGGASATTG